MAGLRRDPPGRGQQPGQVVDRATQPPPPSPDGRVAVTDCGQLSCPSLCPAQRPAGIDQQLLRIGDGAVGQPGQLPGNAADHRLCLIAALCRAQP